jgi:hypothetical protein
VPRSLVRVREIRRALPPSDLNTRIARLAVLYEDLRIEFYAASAPAIDLFDSPIGDLYRRLYFIRRATATTLEIKGAIQRLHQLPEFQERIRTKFTPQQAASWQSAVDFLVANDAALKRIRDDVGGHFSEKAADYALNNIGDREAGTLIINEGRKHNSAGPVLKFVHAIVAMAMTQHNEGDAAEFYENTLKMLKECLAHITQQVHVITYHYLWPRFG